MALAALLGAAVAGPGVAQAEEPSDFEWRLPSRYSGATDARGRIAERLPHELRRGPWSVYLTISGPACDEEARHRWSSSGRQLRAERLGPCRYRVRLPHEGAYRLQLAGRLHGRPIGPLKKRVTVRDWLIVALGDSVASGEGVPESPRFLPGPVWQSRRCHRSSRAGVARAARQIEADDGRSSVTFIHLACSGASVRAGLLGPYAGAVPPRDEPPLEPQVDVLEQIARTRTVDAVLLSAGANDVNFSGIAAFCALRPSSDCFDEPLPRRFGGDGVRSPLEAVRRNLTALNVSYRRLARRLAAISPRPPVYVTEYFDPTRDERGASCESFFGAIGANEVEQSRTEILEPLNRVLAEAAGAYGWQRVGEIAASFRTHGYCAGRDAWVSSLEDSLRELGGIRDRHRGTLHPNGAGHEVIGALVAAELERDLYPDVEFALRPFPMPADDDRGGISTPVAIAIVLAAWMLWPALFALLVAIGLGLLAWAIRDTVLPLLLGLAAGVLILIDPGRTSTRLRRPDPDSPLRDAAEPLITLAKTARPLLLPLLVVLAIGFAGRAPLLQIGVAAAVTVAGWKLIVAREAQKSDVPLGWERQPALDAVRHAAKFAAIAVLLGGAVVLVARLAGFDPPYFAAVGDIASGLLALAVFLWSAALALRLVSYATRPLRVAIALLLGLALFALAAGVGALPGAGLAGDEWLPAARMLGLAALALLAIEAVAGVAAGRAGRLGGPAAQFVAVRWGGKPTSPVRYAARFGFTAAGAAALVLAVATGWGLIDAAQRPGPAEPPEAESTEARLASSVLRGDGGLELARRYAPLLVFAENERWSPSRVDPYIAAARLSGPPGTDPRPRRLPRKCPEFGQTHCYQLSLGCPDPESELCSGEIRESGRLYRDGAVYVRVLEKGRPGQAEPRGAFIDSGPFRDELRKLVQYWYFYPYNEWRAPVFAGLLVQRHEADWEAVTIGFDGGDRPLFVADSAHCAGSWRNWSEVEASTRLPGPRTHPLVAVAEGSHANYPGAGEKRSPDWASCAGAPGGAATALSFASNIRDRTGYGWYWFPPAEGWIRAAADRPPMNFPGRWGSGGEVVLRTLVANELAREGAPATPSLQPLWREPVKTIFCGRYDPRRCEG